jgi:dipeptidyl aminopeptidase/acylaminoacyl peptidase
LIIHGDRDLNVPVEDAIMIRDLLIQNGNPEVELCIVKGADHSFQIAPEDEDLRIKERMSLESFRRPYQEEYFRAVVAFLKKHLLCADGVTP